MDYIKGERIKVRALISRGRWENPQQQQLQFRHSPEQAGFTYLSTYILVLHSKNEREILRPSYSFLFRHPNKVCSLALPNGFRRYTTY